VDKNDLLLIGKVVGTHGIKGCVKVYSYAESASLFKPNSLILVKNRGGGEKTYTVNWANPYKNIIRMSIEGVTSLTSAETLLGSELYIEKAMLSEPEEGEYYWFDIIGLSVFTTDDDYIGRVESIIPTGSNDIYLVKNPDKDQNNEMLIPAIESVVIEIDLKSATMRVDLPEGL